MSTEPRVSSTTDGGHVQWPIVHTVPGAAGGVPSAIAVPALPAHVLLEPLVVGRSRGRHVRVRQHQPDRKSTRLNSSHVAISYAVFCLKKKNEKLTYGHEQY